MRSKLVKEPDNFVPKLGYLKDFVGHQNLVEFKTNGGYYGVGILARVSASKTKTEPHGKFVLIPLDTINKNHSGPRPPSYNGLAHVSAFRKSEKTYTFQLKN